MGFVHLLFHHIGGQVGHTGNSTHGAGRDELGLFISTFFRQVHAHKGVKNLGLHALTGAIDGQNEGRIGPIKGVPGADKGCLVLLRFFHGCT